MKKNLIALHRVVLIAVILLLTGVSNFKAQSVSVNPTSVCEGNSFTATASYSAFFTTITSYEWSLNGGPVIATTTSNNYTYSSAPVGNNTVNVKINYLFLGFIPANAPASITFTVNANLPASVSISTNPGTPVCAGTPVTFTATATNGGSAPTYQWSVNNVNAGTNSPTFTSSTLNNNDQVKVVMTSNASPCSTNSPATSNILTISTLDKTLLGTGVNWSGAANWSPLGIPTNINCVNIPNGKSVLVDIPNATAKNVTVASGGRLTVNANQNLTVTDKITNNNVSNLIPSTTPQQYYFSIESDGNLIQTNNIANSGSITAKRKVTNLTNDGTTKVDYVYWSSPVSGQNLLNFSPNTPTNMFLSYRESNDRFYQTADSQFQPGKGYAIRAEAGIVTKDFNFTGIPNNGDYTFNLVKSANDADGTVHGYNMIGNPYPSNINFDALYEANKTLIFNTLYFWKNNTYMQYQAGSTYSGNNYIVYNATGGSTSVTSGTIKVGQAVIVQAKNSGALIFKNAYRVNTAGTFYQKNAGKNGDKNRFWLNLISPSGIINSQLIGYVDGATDGLDDDYDSESFDTYSDLFYSVLEDKKMIIQGKSNNFKDTDKVQLGGNFFVTGSYTIALDLAEGIFKNDTPIYLKDKLTGTQTDLTRTNYTFQAEKGLTDNRFEIVYKPDAVLSTGEAVKENIIIYRSSNNFVIKAKKNIVNLELYDTAGRLILNIKPNSVETMINADQLLNGIFLMKINLGNGEVITKKIRK